MTSTASMHDAGRDDRVLPITRLTAGVIVPVLLFAFLALWPAPDRTDDFFAWTIRPDMTPLVMGSGYLAGVWFFGRVLTARTWHTVWTSFPAIGTFATLNLVATLKHWDRFNHDHVAFFAWLVVYILTPVLVFAVWWLNRQRDPGPGPSDLRAPTWLRAASGAVALALTIVAVALFASGKGSNDWWPWALSDLTARIMCAWVALGAVFALTLATEARWDSWVLPLQSLVIGSVLVGVSVLRARGDFDWDAVKTWAFVLLLAGSAVGAAILLAVRARGSRPA